MRQQSIPGTPSRHIFSFDPLGKRVSQHIKDYINARPRKFKTFVDKFNKWKECKQRRAIGLVLAHCKRHKGLFELLYFCYQWALKSNCVNDDGTDRTPEENEKLRQEVGGAPAYNRLTICLTFIQFGLGKLDVETFAHDRPFLEEVSPNHVLLFPFSPGFQTDIFNEDPETPEQVVDPRFLEEVNLFEQHGGIGTKFVQFLRSLSTLKFARMKRQSFVAFGLLKTFVAQEHIRLHKVEPIYLEIYGNILEMSIRLGC